jgi:hypothetical protein
MLWLVAIIIVGAFLIQLAFFLSLPKTIKLLLMSNTILLLGVNIALSIFLAAFSGTGAIAGYGNLISSVFISVILLLMKKWEGNIYIIFNTPLGIFRSSKRGYRYKFKVKWFKLLATSDKDIAKIKQYFMSNLTEREKLIISKEYLIKQQYSR